MKAQLRAKAEEHKILLNRVEAMTDLQCAWLILSFCCVTRANYYLRTIQPEGSEEFAGAHDTAISKVFNSLLDIRGDQSTFNLANLPCRLGGVGLRNAVRGAQAAYWSSWADSLHMIRKRHLDISDFITVTLGRGGWWASHGSSCATPRKPRRIGFRCSGVGRSGRVAFRPDFDPAADQFPSLSRNGWQQKASDVVENNFLARSIWPTLAHPEQALLRSQQGPMAGLPFTSLPLCAETTFQSQEFRVLFLRRLWQPLPLSSFTCRCGRPLDSRGHHRAARPLARVLGRRGFALESAAARVFREAGGRVTTNVLVQDMDLLPFRQVDNRRLEVVVNGLPLFRRAQLAIDTTMVSPVGSDGTPRRQCATTSGAALDQARRRKERTYPELVQPPGRARLVVLGCEVGGRWSDESRQFLAGLAAAKARSEPKIMKKSTMLCWFRRWSTLMACAAARAFSLFCGFRS